MTRAQRDAVASLKIAAEEVARGGIGCCDAMYNVLYYITKNYNTRYNEAADVLHYAMEVFNPYQCAYYNYWWNDPNAYDLEGRTRTARVVALLLAAEMVRDGSTL